MENGGTFRNIKKNHEGHVIGHHTIPLVRFRLLKKSPVSPIERVGEVTWLDNIAPIGPLITSRKIGFNLINLDLIKLELIWKTKRSSVTWKRHVTTVPCSYWSVSISKGNLNMTYVKWNILKLQVPSSRIQRDRFTQHVETGHVTARTARSLVLPEIGSTSSVLIELTD